jgi:RimJ/RimL family protein N-acetyltransferase
MTQKTITTSRLLLEPWHEGLREEWVSLSADPRVSRWLATGEPIDRAASEAEFEWMIGHWREHGFGWRSAVEKESGHWLGAIGLAYVGENPAGLPPEYIEIGWWLKPEYWGRGLATEGALATRDEGFSEGIADHLWARHNAHNVASGRIMEKIGMTLAREGTGIEDVPIRIYELARDRWLSLIATP